MAYECIEELQSEMNNLTKHGSISFKAIDELHEVYRKAMAFNKLVELYPQKEEIPSDEFFDEMGYIIKEANDEGKQFKY